MQYLIKYTKRDKCIYHISNDLYDTRKFLETLPHSHMLTDEDLDDILSGADGKSGVGYHVDGVEVMVYYGSYAIINQADLI